MCLKSPQNKKTFVKKFYKKTVRKATYFAGFMKYILNCKAKKAEVRDP